MEFGSYKSWTYVFSPLHKWQNLKAITSLVKAFFSLSCSSDCTDQSLLPPPASRSSWLCHSCTCPGKSPSIPMRVSQPCCHGKKDRLNRGWSQTTTAQTLPGRAVLSAVAQGGRKHGLSHAPHPPQKCHLSLMSHWLVKGSSRTRLISSPLCKSSVVRGHYFISESNTADSNENRLFQKTVWNLWLCTNLAETDNPVCSAW